MSSVQDADRILVLENGHVAGLGTHDELLKTCDFYRDTYLAQNRASAEAEKDGAATDGTAAKGGEVDAR